jgi:small subunit ribosomal protein S25e
MGKKPTLSALEKRLKKEAEKQKTAQQKATTIIEKGPKDIIPPSKEELNKFISSSKIITPYMIAEKFNIKLSIAKQILKDLVKEGILSIVGGDNRIRIYVPLIKTISSSKEKIPKEKTRK